MNISDLYEEYGNIIQMCRGTVFRSMPWECIKRKSGDKYTDHPVFTESDLDDVFGVAILQDRPVFYGDIVYRKDDNTAVTVVTDYYNEDEIRIYYNNSTAVCDYYDFIRNFSWELSEQKPTPKRTFELNGVALPCPSADGMCQYCVDISGVTFYFEQESESREVALAIQRMLVKARDKL